MQNVWRIVWKSNKNGSFRYASGGDIAPFLKEAKDLSVDPERPYMFLSKPVAERVARSMSDLPGVEKVLLREEATSIEIGGTKPEKQ